jgi:hypothetical protein
MPTEEEQLKLIVSLIDNASPGLKTITEQVNELGSASMKRAHETARREISMTQELVKKLTGDLGEATKYLGGLRGGLVAGAAGLALFAWEISRHLTALKEYADRLRDIKEFSADLGVDTADTKNILSQFSKVGVGAETVKEALEGVSKVVSEFGRYQSGQGSTMIADFLQHGGSPEGTANLERMLKYIYEAKDQAEQLNRIHETANNVEENTLKRLAEQRGVRVDQLSLGDRETAAAAKQEYERFFHYNSQLERLEKIKSLTKEQHDQIQKNIEAAKEFAATWDHVAGTLSDIGEMIKDLAISQTLMKDLKDIDKIVTGIKNLMEWLQKGNPDYGKPEMKPGEMAPGYNWRLPGSPGWTPPGRLEKHSELLEEGTKKTGELNDTMTKLVRYLERQEAAGRGGIVLAGYSQDGGVGGGGVAGQGTTPRGFGGGGYRQIPDDGGGGGTTLSPRGTQTYGDRGGRVQAVARTVANRLRQEGLSENAIAGMLANIRDESNFIPSLRHADQPRYGGEAHFAHGLFQEGGAEWNTWAADMRSRGLDPNEAWKDPEEQARFVAGRLKGTIGNQQYAGLLRRMQAARSPGEAAAAFVRGYLKPAAAYQAARSAKYLSGVPGVEAYTGRGEANDYEQRQQENIDAARADRADSVWVHGSGKIKVDVNAPYHTAVSATGSGIFKETEIERQFQMLPAHRGAPSTPISEKDASWYPR